VVWSLAFVPLVLVTGCSHWKGCRLCRYWTRNRAERKGVVPYLGLAKYEGVKELIYAGGKTIVSDQLAEALTDYAQILAANGNSGVIDIPAVGEDGTVGTSRLLLGPASQIIAEPVTVDTPELDDREVVDELNARIRAAGVQHALPVDPDDSADSASEDYAL
jgi:hypothetical protein